MNDLQQAMLRADPRLSRFTPLGRILYHDDFAGGMRGWTQLVGNYAGSLDTMHEGYRQITAPMLSNLTGWDCGTHGALGGTYALKIATLPRRGAQSVAIKRITWQRPCPLRLEFYFTYKPEARDLRLSARDLRSFGLLFDLQNDERRVMPHLRYLSTREGEAVQRWQYKAQTVPFRRIDDQTVTHYHLEDRDWTALPGAAQELCYNEIPSKVNWHYARVDFDLATMRYTHFQCNDVSYPMDDIASLEIPAMPNLRGMLNVAFFVETDTDKRAFLFLDAVLLSGEWD